MPAVQMYKDCVACTCLHEGVTDPVQAVLLTLAAVVVVPPAARVVEQLCPAHRARCAAMIEQGARS